MEPRIVINKGMSIGYRSTLLNRNTPDLELADTTTELTLGVGRHLLLARNGRGKTTLLKTLAGLLPAFAGNFSIEGQVQFVDEELRFDPFLKSHHIFSAIFNAENRERAMVMAEAADSAVAFFAENGCA